MATEDQKLAAWQTKFDAWMKKVDAAIADKCGGLDSRDLPDQPYAQWFDDGKTAKGAASKACKNMSE